MHRADRDIGFLRQHYYDVAVILDNVAVGLRYLSIESVGVAPVGTAQRLVRLMAVRLSEEITVRLPIDLIETLTDRVLWLALDVGAELGISLRCCLDVPERDCPQLVGGQVSALHSQPNDFAGTSLPRRQQLREYPQAFGCAAAAAGPEDPSAG